MAGLNEIMRAEQRFWELDGQTEEIAWERKTASFFDCEVADFSDAEQKIDEQMDQIMPILDKAYDTDSAYISDELRERIEETRNMELMAKAFGKEVTA